MSNSTLAVSPSLPGTSITSTARFFEFQRDGRRVTLVLHSLSPRGTDDKCVSRAQLNAVDAFDRYNSKINELFKRSTAEAKNQYVVVTLDGGVVAVDFLLEPEVWGDHEKLLAELIQSVPVNDSGAYKSDFILTTTYACRDDIERRTGECVITNEQRAWY